jgi:2-methylisocitrate lyase-like PEP mutase family enzyme
MNQHTLAATFRQLHARTTNNILVLPNAWDAMSARVIEAAGARAIATTSAGVSWALGATDGQGLTRDAMAAQVRAIVNAVRVPVTADMESGYGAGTPDDVAATARAVIDAGAVGMNLEDSIGLAGDIILTPEAQADRIAAARGAAVTTGVDLFINARIDTMLFKVGAPAGRVADIVRAALHRRRRRQHLRARCA